MSEEKKIIIDEDWKAQVEAEKQAASQNEVAPEPEGASARSESPTPPASAGGSDNTQTAGANDPPMPPASIGMLMSSLATEALLSMGQFPHPVTGETLVRRNQAKYLIDMLAVLKEKTAGNLSHDEDQALDDILHQLRMAFVSVK